MADSAFRKKGCWLTDHAEIPVPPSKEDFVMTGNLQKRRGGFGKMSQQRWKNRCFVLLKTGNLCYFQAGSFGSVNFCDPPRGILTLDEDVVMTKITRPDGDYAGDAALVIQGGGQRWKLSSEAPGEINRWEEALRSMIKGSTPSVRIAVVNSMRSAESPFYPGAKMVAPQRGEQQQQPPTNYPSTNGGIQAPLMGATSGDGATGEANSPGVWDLICALTVVDLVCYLLHKHEVDFEVFYAALCLTNLVVGWTMMRRASPASRYQGTVGVPLIHGDDVGPLRIALKRRFAGKKDPRPMSIGDVGEVACGVPSASSTVQHYDGPPGTLSAPHHSWSNGDSSVFRVRSKGYMVDKIKVAPAESLYDMVGMDIFATEARVGNMASEIVLDSIAKDLPMVDVPGVPPLLVINVQLPSAPPALMSSAEDGPGYQCVLYFRLKASTALALQNLDTASEGVRLWVSYCQHVGKEDDFHGRFKVQVRPLARMFPERQAGICAVSLPCSHTVVGVKLPDCIAVIANSESLGLPGFVTKYNGKPVLINRSGNWVQGESYIENTINVHRFSFIAKKSLHALKGMFKDMVLHLGFTIEGRSSDELPESLLACSTLNYPMLERAVEFDV